MAEPKANRVKAAKLRAKRDKGKANPVERQWLADYEKRVALSKARAQETHAERFRRPPPVVKTTPMVRTNDGRREADQPREQLALPATSSEFAQSTTPTEGTVTPETHQWSPVVPPPVEGEAPAATPVDPTAAPPPQGTPLVDAAAPAAPTGDPHAAEKFAALVSLITMVGIESAKQLAASFPQIPPALVAQATTPEVTGKLLEVVNESAKRVAMKYGLQSLPMGDEATVAAALVGSGFAWWTLQKRSRLGAAGASSPRPETASPAPRDEPQHPPPPSDLASLFRDD